MEWSLSPEREALRQLARQVADREIRPAAADHDRTRAFPRAVLERVYGAGLFNVTLPQEVGGLGLGVFDECLIMTELCAACAGISLALTANTLALTPIMLGGDADQRRRLLSPFTQSMQLAAFCLTEPEAGSDARSLQTRARRAEGGYVLDGAKRFITNGGVADLYTVFATIDGTPEGITCFAVERGAPGLTVGKEERKLGIRASNTTEVLFDGVQVPAANRIGGEGEGFRIAMRTLDRSRAAISAGALGIAREALEQALRYASQRHQFGRPIAEQGAVGVMLADMGMLVEAARLLVWQAAARIDGGERATIYSAMAKTYASDAAMRVAENAVQIFGGYGYMEDYPVEKLFRDAKIYQIFEGTNQIQRTVIARALVRSLG